MDTIAQGGRGYGPVLSKWNRSLLVVVIMNNGACRTSNMRTRRAAAVNRTQKATVSTHAADPGRLIHGRISSVVFDLGYTKRIWIKTEDTVLIVRTYKVIYVHPEHWVLSPLLQATDLFCLGV